MSNLREFYKVDQLHAEIRELKKTIGVNKKTIHDLETRCDPAGDVQRMASLEEQVKGLELSNRQLNLKVLTGDWPHDKQKLIGDGK